MKIENKRPINKIPHHCHWPGCTVEVEPKLWGCAKHWNMVPSDKRNRLIRLYRPGQEIDKNPSDAYINVLLDIDDWCTDQNKKYGKVP